jgi:hypothetical protein
VSKYLWQATPGVFDRVRVRATAAARVLVHGAGADQPAHRRAGQSDGRDLQQQAGVRIQPLLVINGDYKVPRRGQAAQQAHQCPLQDHVGDRRLRRRVPQGGPQCGGMRSRYLPQGEVQDRVQQVGDVRERWRRAGYPRGPQHNGITGREVGDGAPHAGLADARRPGNDHSDGTIMVPRKSFLAGSQLWEPSQQLHEKSITIPR